jgi:hypothetical protein
MLGVCVCRPSKTRPPSFLTLTRGAPPSSRQPRQAGVGASPGKRGDRWGENKARVRPFFFFFEVRCVRKKQKKHNHRADHHLCARKREREREHTAWTRKHTHMEKKENRSPPQKEGLVLFCRHTHTQKGNSWSRKLRKKDETQGSKPRVIGVEGVGGGRKNNPPPPTLPKPKHNKLRSSRP